MGRRSLPGAVLAGFEGQTLVVRRIDQDLDESWRHELLAPPADAWFGVHAVDVSVGGRVVAAISVSHYVGGEDGGTETLASAVVFDETGAVTNEFELASEAHAVEYLSDTEFVVWRASGSDEILCGRARLRFGTAGLGGLHGPVRRALSAVGATGSHDPRPYLGRQGAP